MHRTLVCTTARARLVSSGSDPLGVRTRADIYGMMGRLGDVIGEGYIGLEATDVLDKRVMVLEAQDRMLARAASVPLSRLHVTNATRIASISRSERA